MHSINIPVLQGLMSQEEHSDIKIRPYLNGNNNNKNQLMAITRGEGCDGQSYIVELQNISTWSILGEGHWEEGH